MLDSHTIPKEDWGVCPYWSVSGTAVPLYSVCVGLAVATGVALAVREIRRHNLPREHSLLIVLASLVGGVLGAKLPYLFWNFSQYLHGVRDPEVLFSGRTILGGLLGGTLAVRLVKRRLGTRTRRGDYLVPGIALGLVIGRIGCFLRGCCHGIVTALPWGVDFGDGLHRHPTELYEAAFCLGWFIYGTRQPKGDQGRLFDRFMLSYFALRFLLEFIRVEPASPLGLTYFQLVCLTVVAWFGLRLRRSAPKCQSLS
jgi:phosphatidylglycerol---prolipoprotein diacylglyceryl transferase